MGSADSLTPVSPGPGIVNSRKQGGVGDRAVLVCGMGA